MLPIIIIQRGYFRPEKSGIIDQALATIPASINYGRTDR
jgi:hypothetical protein